MNARFVRTVAIQRSLSERKIEEGPGLSPNNYNNNNDDDKIMIIIIILIMDF